MENKELTPEIFWYSQSPMKSIPDAIREYHELKTRENVYLSVHGTHGDENAFLEAAKPMMKYLCENYHPHVTVIIDGTKAELLEGLKTAKCDDYILD